MSIYLSTAIQTMQLAARGAVTVQQYSDALPVLQAARETVNTGRDAARYLRLLESGDTARLREILQRDIDAGRAMERALTENHE